MTLLRDLQRDAVDPNVNITTLLRKARILAARLDNPDFLAWIQHEQNGYPDQRNLSDYRILRTDAKAHLVIGLTQLKNAGVMASEIPEGYRHFATTSSKRRRQTRAKPPPGEVPPRQEKVTQIFNYISGGVAHIASLNSSSVSNAVHAGSMNDSQIQQAGSRSTQTASFSIGPKDRADLERLVAEMSEHLSELNLQEKSQRKAEAQLRTIQAQLADDVPAIGSLIATAAQPTVWRWIGTALAALFASQRHHS